VKPLVGLSTPSGTYNFDPKLLIPLSNFKAETCTYDGLMLQEIQPLLLDEEMYLCQALKIGIANFTHIIYTQGKI